MASQVMRITLKAYEHQLVDASARKIIDTVKKTGSEVSGPVPLPTKKEVVTILRAVHKYKDSREQFEQRTHKRLIDIIAPTQKTVDALQRLEMPAGVYRHQNENQISNSYSDDRFEFDLYLDVRTHPRQTGRNVRQVHSARKRAAVTGKAYGIPAQR